MLSILIVGYFVLRARKPIASRVSLVNPTTTWPLATVVAAAVAAGLAIIVAGTLADSPLTALVLGGAIGFAILLTGRTKVPTRVVYDRGGSFMDPGAVVAAIGLFVLLFFAFTR